MSASEPQEEEKLFLPDPEPEPVVVWVRAICGFLFGLFWAGVIWINLHGPERVPTLLLFTVLPAAFAYAAARYGDPFWESWRRH